MVLGSMGDERTTDTGFKKIEAKDTVYKTGATRDSRRGKGRLVWMPWDALFCISRIYEEGNLGRGWRNWEAGMPVEDLLDSSIRHLTQHVSGHRSEPHLSQGCWNAINALQMSIWIWEGLRDPELGRLPDHRHLWKPGDPYPPPLSEPEEKWLRAVGVRPVGEAGQA